MALKKRGLLAPLVAYLALLASSPLLVAQALQALPEEARTSLFTPVEGEGGGELAASGSWDLSLLASAALSAGADRGLALGQVQPLLFRQSPDLLLSFLFDRSWYVEARVSPEPGQSRYALGYHGKEGEVLTEARLGNSGIGLPGLPFVELGEGGAYSFGALVKARLGDFGAGALLRYDQAERVRRRYIGSTEIAESGQPPGAFIRGRWFLLGSPVPLGLRVYVESLAGTLAGTDGSRWRALTADEFLVEEPGSAIALDRASTTRVAASWPGLAPVDLSIEGLPAALLFDPAAAPTAWEELSRYSLGTGLSEAFVRDRAANRRDTDYEVILGRDGTGRVAWAGTGTPDPARPFAADLPDLYSRIPDQPGAAFAELEAFEIVAVRLTGTGTIAIDKDAIPASIEVLRDGVPDSAFELDQGGAGLRLLRPPEATETIEVSYLRQSAERRAASFTAGLAGTWGGPGGLSAWAALAGHVGVPGLGYAERGSTDPAVLTLTAGAADGEGRLTWRGGIAGLVSSAESSGRYRIEGMESAGSQASSFYPAGAATTAGFSFVEASNPIPDLDRAWPRLSALLHADGSASKGLLVSTTAAGDQVLEKIIESPPVAAFGSLVAFVRSSGSGTGTLRLVLDSGPGSLPLLAVEVPLVEVAGDWRRLSFAYASGGRVSISAGEGGADTTISVQASYDPLASGASRLVLEFLGLSAGDGVDLDEILLEDPRSSASLDFLGRLRYLDGEATLLFGGRPLLSGLDLSLDAAGGFSDDSFVDSGLSFATGLGPLSVRLGLRGLADSSGLLVRASHELVLAPPGLPLRLAERFANDPGSGGFERVDALGLEAKGIGQASVEGAARRISGSATSGLAQEWKARLRLTDFLSAELDARQRLDGSAAELPADYAGAWRDSSFLLLPLPSSSPASRSLVAKAGVSAGSGGEILVAGMSSVLRPGSAPDTLDDFTLRSAPLLPLPGGLHLAPWYRRGYSGTGPGDDPGMAEFLSTAWSGLVGATVLWNSLPFAEFLDGDLPARFSAVSGPAPVGYRSYATEAGLALSRDPGASLLEAFLPSLLRLSWKRELSTKGGGLRDRGGLSAKMDFAALELFGSRGLRPLFRSYASDEYRLSLSGGFEAPTGQGVDSWQLSTQAIASLLGEPSRPGDSLVADNGLSVSVTPAGMTWSGKVGADLSRQVEKGPLLDAFRLLTAGASVPGPKEEARFASAYLRSLASLGPRARTVVGFDAELKGGRTDSMVSGPDLALSESYETRLTVPERLSFRARLALTQAWSSTNASLALAAEASIGLTLSF